MTARDDILARIRAASPGTASHPGAFEPAAAPADWASFAAAADEAGSEVRGPLARADLGEHVGEQIERWGGGRAVAQPAAAEWLGGGPWESASAAADPHSFADVAVGIARASLCVAENGALAIPPRLAPQRSLLFLCQRLILLAPAGFVVRDMHAAAAATAEDAAAGPCFQWIAGPSKTADIEQQLVVGAHGPRALLVIGVDGSSG